MGGDNYRSRVLETALADSEHIAVGKNCGSSPFRHTVIQIMILSATLHNHLPKLI